MQKPKVLIVCTGNARRSQMAEGILRAIAGDILEVHSAGANPAGFVDPRVVQVLAEIGVDISHHSSKSVREFFGQPVETLITVCSAAERACPNLPGQTTRFYWPFRDPGHAKGSEEQIMNEYRRIRDKIRVRFEAYAKDRRIRLAAQSELTVK